MIYVSQTLKQSTAITKPLYMFFTIVYFLCIYGIYLNLLASRSDSRSVSTSPSLTGPFTFLMIERFEASRNSTRTWVTPPRDPVLPMILVTRACLSSDSYKEN